MGEGAALNPLGTASIGIYEMEEDAALYETRQMSQIFVHPNYVPPTDGFDGELPRLLRRDPGAHHPPVGACQLTSLAGPGPLCPPHRTFRLPLELRL